MPNLHNADGSLELSQLLPKFHIRHELALGSSWGDGIEFTAELGAQGLVCLPEQGGRGMDYDVESMP